MTKISAGVRCAKSVEALEQGAVGLAMMVRLLKPLFVSPFVSQTMRRFVIDPSAEDLAALALLAETGTLRSVVERTHSLTEVPEALARIEARHVRGKIVVDVRV